MENLLSLSTSHSKVRYYHARCPKTNFVTRFRGFFVNYKNFLQENNISSTVS